MLGVFASKAVNAGGTDGLWFGNGTFFFKQFVAVAAASAYAFVFTYIMLSLINMITRVRVSEAEEALGLDVALHGEKAYDEGVI